LTGFVLEFVQRFFIVWWIALLMGGLSGFEWIIFAIAHKQDF